MRHILRDRLRSLLVLLLVCLAAMTAVLDKLNGLDCVRVPALTKVYAGCASSAKPVYAGFVEGSYYNWSRDEAIARTVMTVTCLEDLGLVPYTSTWPAL